MTMGGGVASVSELYTMSTLKRAYWMDCSVCNRKSLISTNGHGVTGFDCEHCGFIVIPRHPPTEEEEKALRKRGASAK